MTTGLGGGEYEALIKSHTYQFTGREWVFEEFDHWRSDWSSSPYLLIVGEPGIGKTAVAAKLTRIRDISARHFCISRQAATCDPIIFASSISSQLTCIEGFREKLLASTWPSVSLESSQSIRENYGTAIGININSLSVDASSSSSAIFVKLVVDPLQQLYAAGFSQQVVILVDGLDEAAATGGDGLLELLSNAVGLPKHVKFVLTSRPDSNVLRHFEHARMLYLNSGQNENLADIREYIQSRVRSSAELSDRLREGSVNVDEFVEMATASSQGNFLYLTWILPAIATGQQSISSAGRLPIGLDNIYREFMRTRFLGRNIQQWRKRFRPFLSVLSVAQRPLSLAEVQTFTHIGLQQLYDLVQDARQFLDPTLFEQNKLQLFHASLVDFFSNAASAKEFYIDLVEAHSRLARFYTSRYPTRWAKCDDYGLQFLATHLSAASRGADLRTTLTDIRYIEAKTIRLGVSHVLNDFRMYQSMRDSPDDVVDHLGRALVQASHLLNQASRLNDVAGILHSRIAFESRLSDVLAPWMDSAPLPLITASHPLPDLPDDRLLRGFVGHGAAVNSCVFSPDGQWIVSAADDHVLKVWDITTGSPRLTLRGHKYRVYDCTVSPDGRYILSASLDPALKAWDASTGEELLHLDYEASVLCCSYAPDGSWFVVAIADGLLQIVDLERQSSYWLKGHRAPVITCAISPDGTKIASGSGDGLLKIWDAAAKTEIRTIHAHEASMSCVCFTSDGSRLVTASHDGSVKVFGIETGEEFLSIHEFRYSNPALGSPVFACAATPDTRHLLSASEDGTIKIWDLARGELQAVLDGHTARATKCAVSADGRTVASASWDRTLRLWRFPDIQDGPRDGSGPAHRESTSCSVSRDGTLAATTSGNLVYADTPNIHVWDTASGSLLRSWLGHREPPSDCSFGPADLLATAAGRVKLWRTDSGRLRRGFKRQADDVECCQISPSGRYVLSGGSWRDNTVRLWNMDGALAHELIGHARPVTAACFTPDDRFAISVSSDGMVVKWDLGSGAQAAVWSGDPGSTCCAISPDGRWLVIGSGESSDDEVQIDWSKPDVVENVLVVRSIADGSERVRMVGHSRRVTGCDVTSDGQYVLSVSIDKTCRLWDLDTGQCLAVLFVDGPLLDCAVLPASKRAIVVGSRGVYWLAFFYL